MANKTSDPQSPLVSIICRSVGRPQLGEALEAAAAQTHRPLEIVLVDAAALGEPAFRQVCAGKPVKLALPESALCRSNAANFGLRRASGEYLMFLDDDDWLAPNHVEHLLHHLMTRRDVDAVYSSTRKTDAAGKATLETFQQPFDRVLLMRDNYIPIHSVLFRRKLIDQGCEFDENFTIFEDWDFWLQASELTEFHHLDRCTAFYRSGGASQTAEREAHLQRFDSDHKLGQARAAIYDKWMGRWQGEQMNRLIGASQRDQGRERQTHRRTQQGAGRPAASQTKSGTESAGAGSPNRGNRTLARQTAIQDRRVGKSQYRLARFTFPGANPTARRAWLPKLENNAALALVGWSFEIADRRQSVSGSYRLAGPGDSGC